MRITDGMIFKEIKQNVMTARLRVSEAQADSERAMMGAPKDLDPVMISRHEVLKTSSARLQSMDKVGLEAEQFLRTSESALQNVNDILTRVREIAVAGSNDLSVSQDRTALSMEIQELREQFFSVVNTQHDGRYVFSGTLTNTQPFLEDGTYQGNETVRQVRIAPSTSVEANLIGSSISTSEAGDLFQILARLQEGFNTDDPSAIRGELNNLEVGHEQVINQRSVVGSRLKGIDDARNYREELDLSIEERKAENIDITAEEAFTNFTHSQYALQAAMAQVQKVMQSLLSGLF